MPDSRPEALAHIGILMIRALHANYTWRRIGPGELGMCSPDGVVRLRISGKVRDPLSLADIEEQARIHGVWRDE